LQRDLFSIDGLNLKPAGGRVEPRLWMQRLIIWKEPGKEIRNIPLKPGLNVIWSPDDGSRRGQIGHGGGKTTFCRLLRYCLGESGYGPDAQRRAVLEKMPAGQVGAEVRLDGETWLIRRALGLHKEDYVFQGPSFAEISSLPAEPTGMHPFTDAATRSFLDGAVQLMPASIGSDGAWQALLAWMTRDQECRFGNMLDWRSPDSGSHSPVSGRNRSQEDRLAVMRIVLDALRPEEIDTDRRRDAIASNLSKQRTEAEQLAWNLARLRRGLARNLSLNPDNTSGLDATIIKTRASEQLARVQGLPTVATLDRLRAARSEVEGAVREQEQAKAAIEITSNKKASEELLVKVLGDELPELSAQNQRMEHPVCPVCGVLIDRVRAEGCGISEHTCDLEALRLQVSKKLEMHRNALAETVRLQGELATLQGRLAIADQRLQQQRESLAQLERAAQDRSEEIRSAERILDRVMEFDQASAELENAVARSEGSFKVLGEELEVHRSAVTDIVTQLSDRFDAVFREVTPTYARCSVKLDGNGFGLKVPADGLAIGSLKIAVFDLAVMSMAIEGKTRHPGFLIHDSPREADLGGSIYTGLFDLAKKMDGFGSGPLFQYIITTTTKPPAEFCSAPWLRLTVKGSPPEERLLRMDL
jgi:hypothetical protein